jgi:hypothetical protein
LFMPGLWRALLESQSFFPYKMDFYRKMPKGAQQPQGLTAAGGEVTFTPPQALSLY